jgi:hypothetical protein
MKKTFAFNYPMVEWVFTSFSLEAYPKRYETPVSFYSANATIKRLTCLLGYFDAIEASAKRADPVLKNAGQLPPATTTCHPLSPRAACVLSKSPNDSVRISSQPRFVRARRGRLSGSDHQGAAPLFEEDRRSAASLGAGGHRWAFPFMTKQELNDGT